MTGPALTLHGVNVPNRINAIDNPPAIGNGAQAIPPAFSIPSVSVHKRIAAIGNPAVPGTATQVTASQLHATRNNTPLAAPSQANVPQIDAFQTDAPQSVADQHAGPLHSLLAPINTDGMTDEARNLFEQRITDEQLGLYDPIVRRQEVDFWEAPVIPPAAKHGDLLMMPPSSSRLHATDDMEANRGLEQADLPSTAVILDMAAEAETGDTHEEVDDVSDEAIARMFQAPVEPPKGRRGKEAPQRTQSSQSLRRNRSWRMRRTNTCQH
ncbi:putative urease accessory protein ureG-like [Venturia nashicola]|nr:putative urease accessory protein ureG-like [Venturia nashicola]